jgi:hypothetical protein
MTELLSQPWRLATSTGASEQYQPVGGSVLMGQDTVQITYSLHGLQAGGADASAIIIDQGNNDACQNQPGCRWHYISLSNYGLNGLNSSQTVQVPLAAFGGLNVGQPINGVLHTRFWCSCQFQVDIASVAVFKS